MAGHDDSGSSEKSLNGLPTFNAENMQNNMKAIYYSRTFMSIIGGVIAGILGFTGLTGFVFYFLVMAITSVGLIAKAGLTIHSYFDSWNQIIFDGILGWLMGIWPDSFISHPIVSLTCKRTPPTMALDFGNGRSQKPQRSLQGHGGPAYDVKFCGNGEDSLLLRSRLMVTFPLQSPFCDF